MPILSPTDKREYDQTAPTGKYLVAPDFSSTALSAFNFVVDEGMSVSSFLNRDGRNERDRQIKKMGSEGFDFRPYTSVTGGIDYDRVSSDTGLIKNDLELYKERNEILRKRREVNQDVMERGSGLAQFLGSMAGYMLDPINVATMPIGLGTAYKGMSVLSNALMTGRNAAAVGVASELAIQPLVYQHKHDIQSPYEFQDALIAVGSVAVGASVLGGAMGGLSGYFRRVAEKSSEFVSLRPATDAIKSIDKNLSVLSQAEKPDLAKIIELEARKESLFKASAVEAKFGKTIEEESVNIIQDLGDQLAAQKAELGPRIEDDILEAYDGFKQGQYETFFAATAASVKKLEKRIVTTTKENVTWARDIAESGGIDKKQAIAEGFDPKDLNIMPVVGKPLFRLQGGMKFDMLAEHFRQNGGVYADFQKQDAMDITNEIIFDPKKFLDPEVDARIEAIRVEIEHLKALDNEVDFQGYYQRISQENIEKDMAILEANQKFAEQMAGPTKTYDDYIVNDLPAAPKATVTGLQREQLDSEGLAANYDRDMADYEALGLKEMNVDGKLVDADSYMKSFDDQVEGLESVRVCAIG